MKTLLLVEDDTKIALALGIRLKAAGYTVITAPDAVHAMDQAVRHAPDIVVLDINLPGGNGFVVAERLRASPKTATLPIVFVTASKTPGLHERARSVGAVALIEKPFSATDLLEAIERGTADGSGDVYDIAI